MENLETLILAATSRLLYLRHHPSFPDPELAPERDALNCIRVLTRILPYLYEKESLASWEERFFWGTRRKRTRKAVISNEILFDGDQQDKVETPGEQENFEEAKPLAEELIDTLVDFLFFANLTLPPQQNGQSKVTYAIWQSGVGCNTTVATTKEYESNRSEVLRLLLTLAGQSMYMNPAVLPNRGVRALTHMCTCPDKKVVLSVICSLLNTVSTAALSTGSGQANHRCHSHSNTTRRRGECHTTRSSSKTQSRFSSHTPYNSSSPFYYTLYQNLRPVQHPRITTVTSLAGFIDHRTFSLSWMG